MKLNKPSCAISRSFEAIAIQSKSVSDTDNTTWFGSGVFVYARFTLRLQWWCELLLCGAGAARAISAFTYAAFAVHIA